MDWTTIIVAGITLLGGGSFGWLINRKAAKRKPELENDSAAVATLKDALADISKLNNNLLEMHEKDQAIIRQKDERILELTSDLTACQMLICRHDGCPFRLPEKGLGPDWYARAKATGQLSDYTNMHDIVKEQGYKLIRMSDAETKRFAAKRSQTNDETM